MSTIIEQQGNIFKERNSDANGVADGTDILNDVSVNKPFHKTTDKTPDKKAKLDKKNALKQVLDTWTPDSAYDANLYNPNGTDEGELMAIYDELKSGNASIDTTVPGIQDLLIGQNAGRNPLKGGEDTYNSSKAYGKEVSPK